MADSLERPELRTVAWRRATHPAGWRPCLLPPSFVVNWGDTPQTPCAWAAPLLTLLEICDVTLAGGGELFGLDARLPWRLTSARHDLGVVA